jgi:2-C-methyl-D-erythritol 4-phosphate cytidylyltransferase
VLVTAPEKTGPVRQWADRFGVSKLAAVMEGGAERHLSVWNGIRAVADEAETIAVHDGARPLASPGAIAMAIAAAAEHGAATLAHRVTETLKRADAARRVTEPVSREELWAMETPQVFRAELLRRAYRQVLASGQSVTDEVSAVQALGEPVYLVENAEPNPKITFPHDLALAEAILAAASGK